MMFEYKYTNMLFTLGVILAIFANQTYGQTIDEIIAGAVEDVGSMDFQQDESGIVLVELDMKFKRKDWEHLHEVRIGHNHRNKRKAIRYETSRWTNKIVPYFLSNVFTSSDLAQIRASFAEWERYTCLDFRPYQQGDSDYIFLQNGAGCSSFVGMIGGRQEVNLAQGCRSKGIIVHELGHAIGFQHEQTRPDRDSYVTIFVQNIVSGMEHNFQKYSTESVNNYGVPYDYTSVMHYGEKAFSSNGLRTIVTTDPASQKVIGSRYGLSFWDIKLANLMYECSATCPQQDCPGEGFLGKDCQCWCYGNPMRLCYEPETTTPKPTTTTTSEVVLPDVNGYIKYSSLGCPGNLIQFLYENFVECSRMCNSNDDCAAFEYSFSVHGCYLKRICDSETLVAKTNYDAAYVKISTNPTTTTTSEVVLPDVNGYIKYSSLGCPGNLIQFLYENFIECSRMCNSNDDCAAFEYSFSVHGCYLKRICDTDSLVAKTNYEAAYVKIHRGVEIDGYAKYPEEGCPGNLLELFDTNTPANCAQLCNQWTQCVGFEYNSVVNGCYLKAVCNKNSLVPKTKTETAYIKIGGDVKGYTKYQSQGCPGNLLEFHDSNSAGNCAGLCNNRQLCVAFEYNNAVDGCYLKRVCDVNSLVPKSETEAAYIIIGGGGDSVSCTDGNMHCASWASSGECQNNPGYMLTYCKKSCQCTEYCA